ncbi:hypothetical protein NLX83_08445 [Allokutzneria sp. A3M-2-11 16]|uniref:hypothetical protein n=1 Tax=Allokutzneria sp. A3M-2-11 16 TaxID=2962043 RepID=UPI0020B6CD08|nr:hypothetical protein [Allokutzneria sp. A3M-2-11 16]MCP3799283.1 hypothetical protein [Allokutzneria sp. A3M-2-11 16]
MITGATLLALGAVVPAAQAAPAGQKECANSHKPDSKIKVSRADAVVVRPKPVKSEAGALDQFHRGETVTTVKGHWDGKRCVSMVENGQNQDVCGTGDPTQRYYVVWIGRYKQVGYVPAGCFW